MKETVPKYTLSYIAQQIITQQISALNPLDAGDYATLIEEYNYFSSLMENLPENEKEDYCGIKDMFKNKFQLYQFNKNPILRAGATNYLECMPFLKKCSIYILNSEMALIAENMKGIPSHDLAICNIIIEEFNKMFDELDRNDTTRKEAYTKK